MLRTEAIAIRESEDAVEGADRHDKSKEVIRRRKSQLYWDLKKSQALRALYADSGEATSKTTWCTESLRVRRGVQKSVSSESARMPWTQRWSHGHQSSREGRLLPT